MKSPVTVVGGAVALTTLLIVLILGLQSGLDPAARQALILSIVGLVGANIPSILALYKADEAQKSGEQAAETATDVKHDLVQYNGSLKEQVKEAVHEMAEDSSDSTIAIVREDTHDG